MRMIKKILVTIDGSPSAMNAAHYAIQIAEQFDAQLKVIYICHYIPNYFRQLNGQNRRFK